MIMTFSCFFPPPETKWTHKCIGKRERKEGRKKDSKAHTPKKISRLHLPWRKAPLVQNSSGNDAACASMALCAVILASKVAEPYR